MKFLKRLFRRRDSRSVVKKRLKEVIAGDRINVAPSVIERIQNSIRDILFAEMGVHNEDMLFAVVSKRCEECTELSVNVSFGMQNAKSAVAS